MLVFGNISHSFTTILHIRDRGIFLSNAFRLYCPLPRDRVAPLRREEGREEGREGVRPVFSSSSTFCVYRVASFSLGGCKFGNPLYVPPLLLRQQTFQDMASQYIFPRRRRRRRKGDEKRKGKENMSPEKWGERRIFKCLGLSLSLRRRPWISRKEAWMI